MKIWHNTRTPTICIAIIAIVSALAGCAGMADFFASPPSNPPERREVVYVPTPAAAPDPAPHVLTPAAPAAPAPAPQIATPAAPVVISQTPGQASPGYYVVTTPQGTPTPTPQGAQTPADAALAAAQSTLPLFGPWGALASGALGALFWVIRGYVWTKGDIKESSQFHPPSNPPANV